MKGGLQRELKMEDFESDRIGGRMQSGEAGLEIGGSEHGG